MRLLLLVLAFPLILAGCAGFSMVPPGPVAAKGMQVTPLTAWNRFNNPRHPTHLEVWTRDGPILDMLVFVGGVADGAPLLALEGNDGGNPLPAFRSSMSPSDIEALFEATVARVRGPRSVTTSGLRPAEFLGGEGFRFEFGYLGSDEVDRHGAATAIVRGGRLYMIAFEGTRLLQFPRGIGEAESIMANARIAAR
jgi:hypothetical protein